MKNKFIIIIFLTFLFKPLLAENLNIQSLNISVDKKSKKTIFKNDVIVTDVDNNIFKTQYAEYDKNQKLLISKGTTSILTSEGYLVSGKNITFDNKKKFITSNDPATIRDIEDNIIYLEKFEYSTKNNFFKSAGNIKIADVNDNTYNFSQIYIDEKKREILGTDIKSFLNQESFKLDPDNKPRVFANTVRLDKDKTEFTKSIFTLCDYRENDKCPPWSLQASEMTHDKKKKTIYYDNAVIKIYDLPIFFLPKLSHPDPTVDRRSGFLTPSFSDSKNLGSGLDVPYFWALGQDRDFTFRNRFFANENPLLSGEYRQAFNKSNLILDFGFTEGYKKPSKTKVGGNKSHIFGKFVKNFKDKNNSEHNIELSIQDVSNDKYLKLYKIKSNLVEYETETLENSLNYSYQNKDFFLGFQAGAYETLKSNFNDKYEYILPDVILDKNLFTDKKLGTLDLQSNLKVHKYDTNKFSSFLINDFDWKSKNFNLSSGFNSKILGKLKNTNYESKNIEKYKSEPTNELFGALGFLTEIDLFKETQNNSYQMLTPKLLLKYSPDHMRKEDDNSRLDRLNIFSLDRLNATNNFEGGASATLGFDYKIKKSDSELDFSLGQVFKPKENRNLPSSSSLDDKSSDVVGYSNYKVNDNLELNYQFALDKNYQELNYNEIGTSISLNQIKFNFNYLEEREHIGNQEYFKTEFKYEKGNDGLFSVETKRNLITNSAEYYNLSYEYLNDCLRAGLVYRREFYNDSELEPENSLMFKITLIPFANLNSPSFNE